MQNCRKSWTWGLLLAGLLVGCERASPPPAATGAREVAQNFFDAMIHQDWPRAYATLHAESQVRFSPEQFSRLAQNYRRGLGLEPDKVHVGACEEHGLEAVAHVSLTGRAVSKHRRFKDAVLLRWTGTDWRVVLSNNFGRTKKAS